MPSEDDLRRLYRERAERARQHTPDFATKAWRARAASSATRTRPWAIAGVAAAVVAAAVAVPVIVHQSRSQQPATVAAAGSPSADRSTSGAGTTGATVTSAPSRPQTTVTTTAVSGPTAADDTAAAGTTSSAKTQKAQPIPATKPAKSSPAADDGVKVTTVAAGTDRMKLRDLNDQLCTTIKEDYSAPGSLELSTLNMEASKDSGVLIVSRHTTRSFLALGLFVSDAKDARAAIADTNRLTVPADAQRLTVDGRSAYFAQLCGSGTLAWQWRPGRWAVAVNVTQQQGTKIANALQESDSPRRLPFKVSEPLLPLDRAPLNEVGRYSEAVPSQLDDWQLTYGTVVEDSGKGTAVVGIKRSDPASSSPGDQPTTVNGRPAVIDSSGGRPNSISITIDLGSGYSASISGEGTAAKLTTFAEGIEFADVEDPNTWFKVSDSVH